MSVKQIIGQLGEDVASKFLQNKGFSVVNRNYSKPWGELDIICQKDGIFHFVEVKSVSCASLPARQETLPTHMYSSENTVYDPSDNVDNKKKRCLSRIIETYLTDKKIENDWQVDVIEVYMDKKQKKANINFIENIDLVQI